ncbi:mechanosensitive ion channel family protein [Parasphingorhabdus sp. DH2-15]|uniref:mechanosensitive ion channel family protein n=1 Tax=Parasphingorhabdus sp. DH2-15 TaxID=3444112 RepID=UPI003F6843FE
MKYIFSAQTSTLPEISESLSSFSTLSRDIWTWLESHSVEVAIAFAIGAIIFAVLLFARNRIRGYAQKQSDRLAITTIVTRTLGKTNSFFLMLVSIKAVTGAVNTPEAINNIIIFLFTIAAVLQGAIWIREIILGFIEKRASNESGEVSETLTNALALIRVIVSVAVFAIATIMILANLGVDVTGLVAGLGIGGIAIGLAAQGIFEELFAALSIIFDKPFQNGETISYDNTVATVEKIGLKSTRLRSVFGEEVIISNSNLLDKEIINYTRLDRRRTRYGIGVIYQTDPKQAARIPDFLREIIEEHDGKFIRSGFVGFGDSSINFELDFDIMSSDYEVVYNKRHQIGLAILQRFNDEGLEFAYPTQTTFTAAPDGKMIMPYPKDGFTIAPDH